MNLFIKILVGGLLFFAPFSFAGTEPWAFSVLQGGIVLSFLAVIVTNRHLYATPALKMVTWVLGFLIVCALVQSVFPRTILEGPALHPFTFMPLFTWEHASLFATYLALVWLVVQVYPSYEESSHLLFVLMLAGVAVALCAVGFSRGEYIYKLTGIRGGVGPFLNRNHAGVFFALAAVSSLGFLCARQLRYAKMMARNERHAFYIQQLLLGLVFAGLSASVFATRSRGGMLAWLVGVFSYSFLCFWAVPPKLKKRLKGLFITLFVLGLVGWFISTHIEAINEFAHRTGGTSEGIRKMLYQAAWQLLKEYPLFGIGIGAMPVVITSYTAFPLHEYIERLHCDWLEILLGVGWIGGAILAFFISGFVWIVLRRLKRLDTRKQLFFAGLLSALLVMCVGSTVDFHFFIPGVAFEFFIILGLVCSPTFYKHYTHIKHIYRWQKGILVLVCAAVLYVPTQHTLAWRLFLFGRGLKEEAKIQVFQQGLAHYPSPRYALRLANAYFNAGVYAKDPAQKAAYYGQAHSLATQYLQKYPREKELSILYMRSRPAKGSK